MAPTILDIYEARRRLSPFLRSTPLVHSEWLSSAHRRGRASQGRIDPADAFVQDSWRAQRSAETRLRPARASSRGDDSDRVGRQSWPCRRHGGRATGVAGRRLHAVDRARNEEGGDSASRSAASRRRCGLRRGRARGEKVCSVRGRYLLFAVQPRGRDRWRRVPSRWKSSSGCRLSTRSWCLVGGGGLASGIAIATKAAAPGVTVVGVEVAASTAFATSLARGAISRNHATTLAGRWARRESRARTRSRSIWFAAMSIASSV